MKHQRARNSLNISVHSVRIYVYMDFRCISIDIFYRVLLLLSILYTLYVFSFRFFLPFFYIIPLFREDNFLSRDTMKVNTDIGKRVKDSSFFFRKSLEQNEQ